MTRARIIPRMLAALLAALLALAGCGQKGDLYLPDRDARNEQPGR